MKLGRAFSVLFLFLVLSFPLFPAQRMDFMLFNLSNSDDPKADFLQMSKEFSAAMAPMFYGEAETRGSAGFEIGLGYSFTKISLDETYWKNALYDEPVSSGIPPCYSGLDLHVSKGFGFGLKLFGNLRYFVLSEMISGGGGFEYAINEGLKYAPDIAIGAGYNRLFGSKDLNMQMIDLRLKISKTFVAGYQVKLTPSMAYSHLFSFASSNRLGGYFDYSKQTDGYVFNPKGEPFYFSQEFINIDRIFIGFKVVSGYFGFEIEAAIPVNAGKSFSLNAGFSAVM
ncbi:MAG TPA: hypothetical protein PKG52_06025 [bacterium]|nr:hypothetical protein [bacterium]HPS29315.1 hypothetical protein [bacterium]